MEGSNVLLYRREYSPTPKFNATNFNKYNDSLMTKVEYGTTESKNAQNGECRWRYFKIKKDIPSLFVTLFENKRLIESLEQACITYCHGYMDAGEAYYNNAMAEARKQLSNPRSDSAEALDRLGCICIEQKKFPKAITCFEYSLHMRKLVYGKYDDHTKILQSLTYLGTAWYLCEHYDRAITVFEKSLEMARSLDHGEHEALILQNLGICWEELREHHTALTCYDKAKRIRRKIVKEKFYVGSHIKPALF